MALPKQKPRASGSKRRASARPSNPRSRKIEAPEEVVTHDSSWTNEVLAVGLFVVGVFLLLSLVSHWQLIQSGNAIAAADGNVSRENIMGIFGHVISTLFMGMLGLSAFVPVLGSFLVAYSVFHIDERNFDFKLNSNLPILIGVVSLLLSSSVLAALFLGELGGGKIGFFIAVPLRQGVGLGGSLLVSFSFLLLSIALLSQKSLARLIDGSFLLVGYVLQFLCLRIPMLLWEGFSAAISLIWKNIVEGGSRTSEWIQDMRHEKENKSMSETDLKNAVGRYQARKLKHRKLKKRTKSQEEETAAADESSVVEEVREVVVQRQIPPQKMTKEQLKKVKQRIEEVREAKRIIDDADYGSYQAPSLELLAQATHEPTEENDQLLRALSAKIEVKLKDFNIDGQVTHVHPGPVVTLFEFKPAAGVKVGKIASLQDDLAMSLRATSIRIIAPIPKRGTVGIEVPNKQREVVRLRELLESEACLSAESLLSVPIGKDVYGNPVVADIANMPHLLMAGATGTGKSVCINAFLLSLIYRANPAELGLILIDPKILELSVYDGIPHLRVPVVTEPKKAKAVLLWAVNEMERRYRLMQKYGVRNIDGYNAIAKGEVRELDEATNEPVEKKKGAAVEILTSLKKGSRKNPIAHDELLIGDQKSTTTRTHPVPDEEEPEISGDVNREDTNLLTTDSISGITRTMRPLPKIVIVIDELADLMMTVGKEVEELITRLAQKARAAGVHLILATQRPSVDVITGLIKANFPARLSFRVSSRIDSRTILDAMGAEKLLGKGDMLFMRPGEMQPQRVHGAFVTDTEVLRVVSEIKKHSKPHYSQEILDMCEKVIAEDSGDGSSGEGSGAEEYDEFYDKAVELVLEKGQASTSMVQRVFRIGYNRAARIIEMMEREGIVGPIDGAKPRQVLSSGRDFE